MAITFYSFLKKIIQIRPSFGYFPPFLNTTTNISQLIINGKRVDDVLGIQTRDHMMECADKSTELWRHPCLTFKHQMCLILIKQQRKI